MASVINNTNKPLVVLRKEAGYSRNKAAVLLDIGLTTLGRYEKGENDVPLSIVEKMAKLYKKPFDDVRFAVMKTNASEEFQVSPHITIEVAPELDNRIRLWSRLGNETPEELTIRLLEEYVDDCEEAEKISAGVARGDIETLPYAQVRHELELAD